MLLADGPQPELSSPATALRDVKLEKLSLESPGRYLASKAQVAIGAAAAAALGAALILVGVSLRGPSQPDRLQAATTDLNSSNLNIRISGIDALQEIIKTSPSDQPTVIRMLSTFIRDRSPAGNSDGIVTSEIQDALTVIKTRNASNDDGAIVDLAGADLTNASLGGIDLSNANLTNADLTDADLSSANLKDANLSNAYFGGAILGGINLTGANVDGASFYQTLLCSGSVPTHPGDGYNCGK